MGNLWPTTFSSVQNEATGSPLPSIWVIGATKTGKSSFIASTLAKKVLVLDFDGSWATLQYHVPGKVIDIRKEAAKIEGANIPLALFTAFWNVVSEIKPGEYDLIGVDGIEYIFEGSFQYVQKNPTIFGKSAGQFNGTMGTKFGWGTTKNDLWPFLIRTLESKCETVILISHPKEFVDKSSGSKTGRLTFKGVDLTELVTLVLWCFAPTDDDPEGNKPGTPAHKGKYWAVVRKNRLTWFYKQENGFPRQYAILPNKLILETGASYAELIHGYMNAPKPDYGTLNDVKGDPTRVELSEDDKKVIESQEAEQKLELARIELEEKIANERNHLTRTLVGAGKRYATPDELGKRIKELGYDNYVVMRTAIGFVAAELKLQEPANTEPILSSEAPATTAAAVNGKTKVKG